MFIGILNFIFQAACAYYKLLCKDNPMLFRFLIDMQIKNKANKGSFSSHKWLTSQMYKLMYSFNHLQVHFEHIHGATFPISKLPGNLKLKYTSVSHTPTIWSYSHLSSYGYLDRLCLHPPAPTHTSNAVCTIVGG